MKFKYIYLTILAGGLSLNACVDDKGSYDRLPVNELTVEGVETEYSVLAGITELEINPTIKGSVLGEDESQYKYTWYICQSTIINNDHTHTSFGNEKNLKTVVVANPGTYKLYLEITDASTGIEWVASESSLTVTTSLTTGFYLFGDDANGNVAMDFLSMPDSEGDTAVIHNIFTNSAQLKGAEDLMYTGYTYASSAIINLWAVTESGSYKLENSIQDKTIFDIDKNYNESYTFPSGLVQHPVKVLEQFPQQYVYGYAAKYSDRGFITEDGVFIASIMLGEVFASPVNRYSLSSTKLFKPYPKAFYYWDGSSTNTSLKAIVLYDMDANCFVTVEKTGSSYSSIFTEKNCKKLVDQGGAFPWNQDKRTIVYGENNWANSYALMKSTENNTDFYIYKMLVRDPVNPTKVGGYSLTTTEAPELDKAKFISFSPEYPIMIYATDRTFYKYNYETKKADVVKTYDGEITYAAFDWRSRGQLDIVICTYDASAEEDKRGTIYKYELGQTLEITPIMTGRALDKEFVYNTPLKVKKVEYRNSTR